MSYLERFMTKVRAENGGELLSVLSVGDPRNIHSEGEGGERVECSKNKEIDSRSFKILLRHKFQTDLEPPTDKTAKSLLDPECEECHHTGCAAYVELSGGGLLCGGCYALTQRDVARLRAGGHLAARPWGQP